MWNLPDSFEKVMFSVSENRPCDERQYDRLTALSVESDYIRGTVSPYKPDCNTPKAPDKRVVSYLNLASIPQFARYRNVDTLKLHLKDDNICFHTYLKIIEGLAQLSGVKHLELYGSLLNSCSPRLLKRLKLLAPLFEQLESLKLCGIGADVLSVIPAKLPRLKELETGESDWATLSRFDLPGLCTLRVNSLRGLSRISAITEQFRSLRSLSICQSKEKCLTLGEELRELESLELTDIGTLDICGIAESKLHTLKISDCDLDPTPLCKAETLEVLSVKRCCMEQPMPLLTQPDLYELILEDCCISNTAFIGQLPSLQLLDLRGNHIACRLGEESDHYPEPVAFLEHLPSLLVLSMDSAVLDRLNRYCRPFARRFEKRCARWELENQYFAK